jgi:3-phosphoshikimate 1-carboxyvinyltransferase
MQRYFCQPGSVIGGEITVPGDKSVSHRSLMLGGIAEGTTEVRGFLESEDCLATLAALRTLGVNIGRFGGNRVTIHGVGPEGFKAPTAPLDMGNAGTAMRLFMGLLASQSFDSTLVGDASLMKRPMERVAVPLRLMNAAIDTQGGLPPVVIHGGQALKAIDYHLPVASAQVKSAILLAALRAAGRTRVTEPAPTRDHTERMLTAFGVEVLRTERGVAIEGGQRFAAPASMCRETSRRRPSSWCSVPSPPRRAHYSRRGHQPHAHRPSRHAHHDGRRHPRALEERGRPGRADGGRAHRGHRGAREQASRHHRAGSARPAVNR